MQRTIRFVSLLAVLLSPSVALAQTVVGGVSSNGSWYLGIGSGSVCGSATICQVANTILSLINFVAVPVLFAVAFIVFLYGIAQAYIFSHGDLGKVQEGHKLVLYGIIGFVVMISLWGLVNVVANTFGLAGYSAPPLPRSY